MFNKEILDKLLIEADKNLTKQVDLFLIGGTALVIKYLSPRATMDVDSYTKISKELKEAWQKAEVKMGVNIPLSKASITEGPYNMEDRFASYKDLPLKKLNIFVPDPADLVLMKVLRFVGKDRDDISHLVNSCKIHQAVLLKRFSEEMDHLTGNRSTIISHYLLAIEDNYGKEVVEKHVRVLKKMT